MTHADFELAENEKVPPNYFAEALETLKKRANAEGLIVDHDGTEVVRMLLGNAIEQARREQGSEVFSPRQEREFAHTAIIFAEKATDAARMDQTQFVGQKAH